MKFTIRKTAHLGEKLPFGYWAAWFNPQKRTFTCYPVPLAPIIRFLRKTYFFLAVPHKLAWWESRDDLIRDLLAANGKLANELQALRAAQKPALPSGLKTTSAMANAVKAARDDPPAS